MRQKTWIDLLGTDASNCDVVGWSIIRRFGDGSYENLWNFGDQHKASQAMHHWKNGIAERNIIASAPTIKFVNVPMPEYELGGEG